MQKLLRWLRGPKPDTDWVWHETSRGPVMRRRLNGKWQTRAMTPDELHNYMGSRVGW